MVVPKLHAAEKARIAGEVVTQAGVGKRACSICAAGRAWETEVWWLGQGTCGQSGNVPESTAFGICVSLAEETTATAAVDDSPTGCRLCRRVTPWHVDMGGR